MVRDRLSVGGGIVPASFTVAMSSVTAQKPVVVVGWYNQLGGTYCAGGNCNVFGPGFATDAQLIPDCGPSNNHKPCVFSNPGGTMTNVANVTPATGIVSFSMVAARVVGNFAVYFVGETASNVNSVGGRNTVSNAWVPYGSPGGANVTASDGAFHAGNALINSTTGTFLNVDGTDHSSTTSNSVSTGRWTVMGNVSSGNQVMISEAAIADNVSSTSGQRIAACTNQRAYYGTPGSC